MPSCLRLDDEDWPCVDAKRPRRCVPLAAKSSVQTTPTYSTQLCDKTRACGFNRGTNVVSVLLASASSALSIMAVRRAH